MSDNAPALGGSRGGPFPSLAPPLPLDAKAIQIQLTLVNGWVLTLSHVFRPGQFADRFGNPEPDSRAIDAAHQALMHGFKSGFAEGGRFIPISSVLFADLVAVESLVEAALG